MLKNKTVFIAVLALTVVGATTFIFLDEFTSNSDGVEVENTETVNEIPIKTITITSESGHYNTGGHTLWPKVSLDFPTQVQKGTPFDITANWTWVEYEIDENTGEPAIDENTGELEISETASQYDTDLVSYAHNTELQTSVFSGTKFINNSDFEIIRNSTDYQLGWGNNYLVYIQPMIYDEVGPHSKTLTYQIDSLVDFQFYQVMDITVGVGHFELYLQESPPGTINISDSPFVPSGMQSPLDPDAVRLADQDRMHEYAIAEMKATGKTFDEYYYPEPTAQELEDLERVRQFQIENGNGKTMEDIPITAQYIMDNNISNVIDYLANELYTGEFIEEFINQYPDLAAQSFEDIFSYFLFPSAYAASDDISVRGYFYLNDENERLTSAQNVKVCALEYNSVLPAYAQQFNNQEICSTTNSRGYYSLTVPNIDMDNRNSQPDVKVIFSLENDNFTIKNSDRININQIFFTAKQKSNVSGNSGYMGLHYPSTSPDNYSGFPREKISTAYLIYDELNYGYDKINNYFGYSVPFVTVEWGNERLIKSTFFDHETNTIILNHLVVPTYNHFIDDARSPNTIMHEYTHKIHHSVYGLNSTTDLPLGNGCDDHGANRMSGNECAWTEGFAHFMSAAIYNNPVLKFSTYLHPINIENGKYNTLTDGTGGTSFPTNSLNLGTSNEGWVASALWDIYDNSSESGDDINEKKTKLWLTFTDVKESTENIYPASSILNFKDDWDDNGYPSLDSLFSLNNLPITNVPPTTGSTIFSDDFEGTLSQWTLTGDDEIWELRSGIPTGTTGNVASSDDCDKNCYMVSDTIDASQATTLTFDRYISTSIDTNEGLKVEVSTNNGRTWSELVFYSTTPRTDDSTWHTETFDVTSYQSSIFKIKFTGVSSSSSELVQIDDVTVTGSSGGTVPPPTTTSSLFEDNFNDLSNWSKSGDDRWHIVSTWREGMPPDGDSNNKIVVASNCDNPCILTSKTIDLSSHSSATLELLRFVDRSLDGGEYLSIEVFNGRVWTEIAKWGDHNNEDTDDWEFESFNISRYLDDNFKIKITSLQSSSSEDTGLDYIRIVT